MPKSRDRRVVIGKKAAAVRGGRRGKDHLHLHRRRRRRRGKDHLRLHSFMLLREHVTCRERVVPPAARHINVFVPATTAVKLSAAPCCHGTVNRDSVMADKADIHEDGTQGELDFYHRCLGVQPAHGANDELILHVDG